MTRIDHFHFAHYGEPKFFNSDQGSQYTSDAFLNRFAGSSTKNSMDDRSHWLDNVYIEPKNDSTNVRTSNSCD